MTIGQFLTEAQKHGEISAFSYYFNGETDNSTDLEDFQISKDYLTLEGDDYSLNIKGQLNEENIFEFKIQNHTIGLKVWY